MFTRRVVTLLAALALALSAAAIWGVEGDGRDGDTDTNVVASSGAEAGAQTSAPKKKGGGFFKIFKAPFKAVAHLFGKDDSKIARMSERDAARFESAPVVRVEDSTTARKEAADDNDQSARGCLARGRALLEEGRLNEAIAELSRAVDVNSHDPEALNNLGYSLYLNGNYRAAADKLKRAARLAPSDARVLNNLALAQARLGKYDDAYRNFARAGGEFMGHANVAALLIRVGRDDKAAEHLEAARRIQPDSANVLRQLAELYERVGDKAKADDARQALRDADARQNALAASGEQ